MPALAIETVCCSITSWIAVRSDCGEKERGGRRGRPDRLRPLRPPHAGERRLHAAAGEAAVLAAAAGSRRPRRCEGLPGREQGPGGHGSGGESL